MKTIKNRPALEIISHFLYDGFMKKAKHRLLHLIIAAAAIINLVFLFLFQYGLSNATPAVQAANRASEERAAYDAASGFNTKTADTENSAVIITSGQTDTAADETDGSADETAAEAEALPEEPEAGEITAPENASDEAETDSSESSDSSEASASSETSASSAGSSIQKPGAGTASSDTLSGNDAARTEIKDPVITLSSDLPEISQDNLTSLARILHDLDYLSADDGYGNDISDQITVEYQGSSTDYSSYHVTFSVTNRAGRSAKEETDLTVSGSTHPVLVLTSETVTIPLDSSFDYMDYVKTARDTNGLPIGDYISTSGNVDTSTSGTYELTYVLVSQINYDRVEKTLTVKVE